MRDPLPGCGSLFEDFLRDGSSCASNPLTYFFSNFILVRKNICPLFQNEVVGRTASGKGFLTSYSSERAGCFVSSFFLGEDLPLGSFEVLCFLVSSSSWILGVRSKSTSGHFQLPSLTNQRTLRGVQTDSGWWRNSCRFTATISTPNTTNI